MAKGIAPTERRPWHQILKRGAGKGLRASWVLVKLLAPVSVAVTILQHTPVLPWLTRLFASMMGWLGLSGEAAIVLVVGNAVGLYSALGAMSSLTLSAREILILSLMLSFSHNLLVETAVTSRLGVGFWRVIGYRVGLALLSGLVLNLAFSGWDATFRRGEAVTAFELKPYTVETPAAGQSAGDTSPQYLPGLEQTRVAEPVSAASVAATALDASIASAVSPASAASAVSPASAASAASPTSAALSESPESLASSTTSVTSASLEASAPASWSEWARGVFLDSVQELTQTILLLVAILLPLMIFVEYLKEWRALEALAAAAAPYMGKLGLSGKASFPLIAGLVFGLAYGAGVILEAARDGDLSYQDRHLLCVFLIACHAAVEDTLLFVPFGVNPFLLLGSRLLLAIGLTALVARWPQRGPAASVSV